MISDPPSRLASRRGFTLIEIMVALATGLILLNAAFALLSGTQRFIRRIEQTGVRTDVLTGQVLWVVTGGTTADYPTGIAQSSLTRGYLLPVSGTTRIMAAAAATYVKFTPDQLAYGAQIYIPTVY